MEFSLKIDPNLHATFQHSLNVIQFQYAHQTEPPSTSCDVQQQGALSYTMYQRYMDVGENGTFDSVEKMLTYQGVASVGEMV